MYGTVPHFCWVNAVAWHEFPIHLLIRWKGAKLCWMRFGWKSALLYSLKPYTFAHPHVCTKMSSYSPAKSYSMTTAYLQSMNKSDSIFWNWFHYDSVNGQESWKGREREREREEKEEESNLRWPVFIWSSFARQPNYVGTIFWWLHALQFHSKNVLVVEVLRIMCYENGESLLSGCTTVN